jgi:calcineurin-binding protein cabin-1
MLALTMYDTIQNAPPEYNQKDSVPAKDSDYQISLDMACRFYNELKVHRPTDWRLCLGLGKIMEKLHRLEDALMEYEKAISSAKNLLEPLYRIHTCRLKELLKAIEIGASVSGGAEKMMLSVSFLPDEESKRAIELRKILDEKFGAQGTPSEVLGGITDAMCALHFCIDIHKYHYPAICRLAKTYWTLGLKEKALAMITSCFKKGKEPFSINMWEDQALCSIKKPTGYSKDYKIGRAPDVISGIGREESSRKFVSKVRKALMFYIEVLSEYKDVETLDAIREFLTKTKQWRCLSDLSKQLNPSVASIKPLETSPDQNVTPLVIAPMAEPTDNTTADNQGLSIAIDDCMMIISNDDPEPPKMIP